MFGGWPRQINEDQEKRAQARYGAITSLSPQINVRFNQFNNFMTEVKHKIRNIRIKVLRGLEPDLYNGHRSFAV